MYKPLLAVQSQWWAARDWLSPVLRESKFNEHGRITPEEFVAAGDFLAYKFPVWQWQKGESSKARDFLPEGQQYLITRGVPCLRRATAVNYSIADEDAERLLSFLDEAEEALGPDGKTRSASNGEEEWVETHVKRGVGAASAPAEIPDIPDMDEPSGSGTAPDMSKLAISAGGGGVSPKEDDVPDMDDIPDMDDEQDELGEQLEENEEGDEAVVVRPTAAAVAKNATTGNLLQVRTYDCFISYDKHYQTPRFWLLGYDEDKNPLTPTQVFQDVPSDHAFKTMTMETFPHSGQLLASVHPCKHAAVMKKFIDRMDDAVVESKRGSAGADSTGPEALGKGTAGAASASKKKGMFGGLVRKVTGGVSTSAAPSSPVAASADGLGADEDLQPEGLQVDFYLVIFLKFIASIVPTIEVDSTTAF